MLADRIVEFMYQQRDVTQCHATALTPTGDEHHFPGTQDFIVKQCACYPYVPRLAEYQVINMRAVVTNRFTCQMVLHFKVAVNRIFITEWGIMLISHLFSLFFH